MPNDPLRTPSGESRTDDDTVLDRFEQAWQAGGTPDLADYLPPAGHPRRTALLAELACIDLERRRKAGQPARADDYLGRFPELANDRRAVLDLLRWEDRLGEPLQRRPEGSKGLDVRDYELLEPLGRGGMGEVYRSRDPGLGRDLALKVLKAEWQSYAEMERRFETEARITASLQHPAIVPVHNLGRLPDGRLYFTMKLVRGQTLQQMLDVGHVSNVTGLANTLAPRLGIFEQVCQAVAYAHSNGVIHRDLKPGNVMVGAFGEVQVMDWGLAKLLPQCGEPQALSLAGDSPATDAQAAHGLLQTDGPVGTPGYMAPEQARGEWERADERLDVFALGAILCTILTGDPPYRGSSGEEMQAKARRADLAEAFARLDSCGADAALLALAKDCLSVDAGSRPRDAGAVAGRVTAYLAGVQERLRAAEVERAAAQARAAEAAAKAAAERRARRFQAGMAAAVLVLVLAGGAGAWWAQQQRAALAARQTHTNAEATGAAEQARKLLDEGWQAQDLARLKEAKAEADRAVGIAHSGPAGEEVQSATEAIQADAAARLERAQLNRRLLDALLDVSRPRETRRGADDASTQTMILARPTLDEQYAAAFRRWWDLDVAGTPDARVAERFQREPLVVVQELIAALDGWMLVRRREKFLEQEWRRLGRLANSLDQDEQRRRLRTLLIDRPPQRAEDVAGLLAARPPWPALWELIRGNPWRRLRVVSGRVNPAKEAALTVVLLAQASSLAGDAAGAEELVRQALAARPNQVVLLNELGRLLERQGRLREAIGCYRAVRAARPGLGAALARVLQLGGQPAEAEAIQRDLLRQQPRNPERHFNLGYVLQMRKKLRQAEVAYRDALALDAQYTDARHNLGTVLQKRNDPDGAIACFRRALALDPRLVQAHYNLGLSLAAKGDLEGASANYRKAVALEPGLIQGHNNLGAVLHRKKDLDGAIASYRRALALDPKAARVHGNLGTALAAKGDRQAAIACYRRAIALDPNDAMPHYNLASTLYTEKDLEGAIASYRRAIALNPAYAAAYNNLGHVLLARRDLDGAANCFRKAIAINPNYAHAHANLGVALQARGDLEGAVASFRRALRLDKTLFQIRRLLGQALLDLGQFTQAREVLRDCLARLPAGHPFRKAVSPLLRKCEVLIALNERLPAVLKGEAEPRSPGERMAFAWLCQQPYQRRNAVAARFYAEAFAAQPKLAEDLFRQARYNAACANAQAAAGRDRDATKPDEKERARLRGQALAWLQADLAAWAQLAEHRPEQRPLARQTLAHWQTDADLAGLRDPTALEKLPADERDAWRKLWTEAGALLKRVSDKK
jgi:tetratricopeptide (TPR) repeat protein